MNKLKKILLSVFMPREALRQGIEALPLLPEALGQELADAEESGLSGMEWAGDNVRGLRIHPNTTLEGWVPPKGLQRVRWAMVEWGDGSPTVSVWAVAKTAREGVFRGLKVR